LLSDLLEHQYPICRRAFRLNKRTQAPQKHVWRAHIILAITDGYQGDEFGWLTLASALGSYQAISAT
jgi:hypothetical protein